MWMITIYKFRYLLNLFQAWIVNMFRKAEDTFYRQHVFATVYSKGPTNQQINIMAGRSIQVQKKQKLPKFLFCTQLMDLLVYWR